MADEQEEILETDDVNMDHRKMRQTHELAGYREGLESGKEAHLQQGFNEGFTYGCVMSREWGRLRGALSALISLVISQSIQDSNPIIVTEMTSLLTQITQRERNSLGSEAMQQTLKHKLNETTYSQPVEVRCKLNDYQRAMERGFTKERQADGNDLASVFELLHTQDTRNGIREFEVHSQTLEHRIQTSGGIVLDTVMHEESDERKDSLELFETLSEDLEKLWSKTFSLAEKIGIGSQKMLLVKNAVLD